MNISAVSSAASAPNFGISLKKNEASDAPQEKHTARKMLLAAGTVLAVTGMALYGIRNAKAAAKAGGKALEAIKENNAVQRKNAIIDHCKSILKQTGLDDKSINHDMTAKQAEKLYADTSRLIENGESVSGFSKMAHKEFGLKIAQSHKSQGLDPVSALRRKAWALVQSLKLRLNPDNMNKSQLKEFLKAQ